MTKWFKALGVALVAVLAMGASAAQALPTFTADEYPVTVTGEQTQEFRLTMETGLFVECEPPTLSGTFTGASSTLTLSADFVDCKLTTPVSTTATVAENGCDLVFHVNETHSETGNYMGTGDLVCPEGQAAVITAGNCEVKLESQNGLGPVTLINGEGEAPWEKYVEVESKVSNSIAYNKTKDGFLCPFDGTGKKTDGSLSGTGTAIGEGDFGGGGRIGITVSD